MSEARWDPFEDSFRIVERFGGRFREGWPFDEEGDAAEEGAFTPPADVFETPEGLSIEVELPGVSMRDVQVTLNGGVLTIDAERTFSRAGGREVLSLEGRWGRMRRHFTLPIRSVPERMMAELTNGVLRVFVPRAPETGRVERIVPTAGADRAHQISID